MSIATNIRIHMKSVEMWKVHLRRDGPRIIKRLCENGSTYSLREVSRRTGLSPTYLSRVKNRKTVISIGAYLKLVSFAGE